MREPTEFGFGQGKMDYNYSLEQPVTLSYGSDALIRKFCRLSDTHILIHLPTDTID